MPAADLVARLPEAWAAATHHPFLLAVRDGTVPPGAFDTWLVQDAYFVEDLLWFQARLLARAPRHAQAVLAGGAAALVSELAWFEERAAERGRPASAGRRAATSRYRELLERLDVAPVATAVTALWVLERVYLDAWTTASPGAPEYRPFVAHWTTPEFAAYVAELERTADALLAGPDGGAPGDGAVAGAGAVAGDLEAVVAEVLRAEVAFWDMAVASEATPE